MHSNPYLIIKLVPKEEKLGTSRENYSLRHKKKKEKIGKVGLKKFKKLKSFKKTYS